MPLPFPNKSTQGTHMKILALAALLMAATTHASAARDSCQELSDAVGEAAAAKPAVEKMLKEKPQDAPMGESWRWLKLTFAESFGAAGVPQEEQEAIFRTIADLDF